MAEREANKEQEGIKPRSQRGRRAKSQDAAAAPAADANRAAKDSAKSRSHRARRPQENAIRLAEPRNARPSAEAVRASDNESQESARRDEKLPEAKRRAVDIETVPTDIERRFVRVGHKYFFPDGARAFTDLGKKIVTPSENTEVIRNMVSIAKARGWEQISASGAERFRKEAWLAGRLAGLTVRGYEATELEHAQLARALARATDSPNPREDDRNAVREVASTKATASEEKASRRSAITGELVDHGAARYMHAADQPMSYFVKVDTDRGTREVWGVDLERAMRESLSNPQRGDVISMRSISREPVTVRGGDRDAHGVSREVTAFRNRWLIEKREFLQARSQAAHVIRNARIEPDQGVKQHPELAGAYVNLRAAELAARQIREAQDQRKFVATVREALAKSIARGEPLPTAQLKGRGRDSPASTRSAEPVPALVRE